MKDFCVQGKKTRTFRQGVQTRKLFFKWMGYLFYFPYFKDFFSQ